MRATHPDSGGDGDVARLAAVTEAWRVLGDADRRRSYDRRRSTEAASEPEAESAQAPPPAASTEQARMEPARFPWRFMLGMAAVGIGVVAVGVVTMPDEPQQPVVDPLLRPGACVNITPTQEAVATSCDAAHDAVVESIVDFDATCVSPARPVRDPQGRGWACVRAATSATG
jgi:hypothetical protein